MAPTSEAKPVIPIEMQRAEVEAVLGSTAFARAPRHYRLLRYLADKYFDGRSADVKEFSIATEVLGRGADFDQGRDAIVRVEMHRLRKKLKEFYECDGLDHQVEVVIHPGQYALCFVSRMSEASNVVANSDQCPAEAPIVSPEPVPVEVPPTEQTPRKVNATEKPAWRTMTVYASVVIASLLGLVVLSRWQSGKVHAGTPIHQESGSAAAALPVTAEVRILCGYTKDKYIDRSGSVWAGDRYYNGGSAVERPRQYFSRTNDPILFQTQRTGDFTYDIPVPRGSYELRLYFTETAYGPGYSIGGGENSRVFNVFLNDSPLLASFDIVADSGGAAVGDVRRFKDVSPASDGKLHLKFASVRGTALVDAIEILPLIDGKQRPIRIVAQETSFTDSTGAIWSPDNYYMGGQLAVHAEPVKAPEDADLYAGERYGNFSYAIPVDRKHAYTATLYMSETYWGTAKGVSGGIGERVFDVYCNGVALLRNFDLYKEYGPLVPVKKTFRNLQPNAQGKLVLQFEPVQNYASVYAIEVTEE